MEIGYEIVSTAILFPPLIQDSKYCFVLSFARGLYLLRHKMRTNGILGVRIYANL